jgi:pimeloyl-ACP methyl ester carboxylesterase
LNPRQAARIVGSFAARAALLTVWFLVCTGPLAAVDRQAAGARRPAQTLCILIGGFNSDPTPAQIAGTAARGEGNSGLYRMSRDLSVEGAMTRYFNWNGSAAGELLRPNPPGALGIAAAVRDHLQAHPFDKLAIVGNSWGGHTAHEVALDLHRHPTPTAIDLLVYLDASSAARAKGRPQGLTANVNHAVNYFTRNAFVWGRLDAGRRMHNIDLGDPVLGYMRGGLPEYNATLNVRAHIAAEWDEKIHSEIISRILKLAQRNAE